MPGADVPIQQCMGPFHSSVIPLLKLLMKIRDKHTTVQFKIGLLSPFGSFPSKFMNSGRACQLWTRRLWQNKFMNPIRNERKRFHWFDGCASTNLCSLWSCGGQGGGLEEVWREHMRNLFVMRYGSRVNGPGGMQGSRLHPSASLTSVLPSSHSTEATGYGLSLDLVLRHSAWAEYGLTISLH